MNRFTTKSENRMQAWRREKKLRLQREARALKRATPRVHSDLLEADRQIRECRKVSDGLLHRLHKFHGDRIRTSAPRGDTAGGQQRVSPARPELSAGTIPGGQG